MKNNIFQVEAGLMKQYVVNYRSWINERNLGCVAKT